MKKESVCEIFLQTLFMCYSKITIILEGLMILNIHGKGEINIYSQNDTFAKILIQF